MPALPQQSSCSAGSATHELRDRAQHLARRAPHPLRVQQVARVLKGDGAAASGLRGVPALRPRVASTSETSRTFAEKAAARSA